MTTELLGPYAVYVPHKKDPMEHRIKLHHLMEHEQYKELLGATYALLDKMQELTEVLEKQIKEKQEKRGVPDTCSTPFRCTWYRAWLV